MHFTLIATCVRFELIGIVVNRVISLPAPLNFRHRLREVNVDSTVVDQNIIHFEICVFARFLLIEFNECILQGVTGSFVTNHLTVFDFSKAAEDDLQIVVSCDRVKFTNKENIFGRCNVSIGNVANNLQYCCTCFRFTFLQHFVHFRIGLSLSVVDVFVSCDSSIFKAFR